jgi:hypothetical protein
MSQVCLTFRTSAEIKEILERTAIEELLTLSGQDEMIVLKWLKAEGNLKRASKEREQSFTTTQN